MLLFVGLGNPGPEHARQRHNVGFMAVDRIMARHEFGPAKRRFHGLVAEGRVGGQKVLALKPMTFMNRSGISVAETASFYKIAPGHIVVFHDELDLVAGKVRAKTGGGAAGHNGLLSLDQHISPGYRRIRIGIGHPGEKSRVLDWVLRDFTSVDMAWLEPLLDAMADAAPMLARGDDPAFMTKVALLTRPPKPPKTPKTPKPEVQEPQA
jgi:PTH1 family peptidyl-tRNA hydrolase